MKLNSITWILLTVMVVLFGFAGAQQMELISIQEPQVTPLPSPIYLSDCPSFSPPYCPDGELVAQPASPDGCTPPPICVTPDTPSDNTTIQPTDTPMSTTEIMLIALVGILVVGIVIIAYIKKR